MKLKSLVTGVFVLSLVSTTAGAGTDTGNMNVSVTVQSNCSLSGGTMDFGTYTSGQAADLTAEGSIDYANCPIGTLSFEMASGQSNDTANRFMADSGNTEQLTYQLYRNSARSAIWGEGTDAQTLQLFQAGGGSLNVYGTIPGGQTVNAGAFSDTIAITMTF